MATIGMMDSAFFVGRQEILTWLNSFLELPYSKIEETANGAASCQLMDALHPGSVQLSRVDYNASRDFECLQNYQVLQEAFQKVGIDKARQRHFQTFVCPCPSPPCPADRCFPPRPSP